MAVTCHLRNPETFAEQKAGLGSEERSRGRQPTERAIRYNQEINGSPDKPGGLSIQLCKSEKKEFYIRYSS